MNTSFISFFFPQLSEISLYKPLWFLIKFIAIKHFKKFSIASVIRQRMVGSPLPEQETHYPKKIAPLIVGT
jgi:hypothetical protein